MTVTSLRGFGGGGGGERILVMEFFIDFLALEGRILVGFFFLG